MNPKFTPSKAVRDVIQFDKEHKQLRSLMDEEKVIPYREISSCSLKNQYYKKSSVPQFANLFTINGILASENQELRVCIEVRLKDDTRVHGYISRDITCSNLSSYHEGVAMGRYILKLIRKVIAREQQATPVARSHAVFSFSACVSLWKSPAYRIGNILYKQLHAQLSSATLRQLLSMRGRTMVHISENASVVHCSSQAFFDETLAPYQIGCGQWFFLMRIHKQPEISQSEPAEAGNFDKGTCARVVKKLEELGHLRRGTRSSDRRSVQLCLTGQGEQLVPVIQGMPLEWNAILCRTLQADEKEQVEGPLDEIIGNAAAYIKR